MKNKKGVVLCWSRINGVFKVKINGEWKKTNGGKDAILLPIK